MLELVAYCNRPSNDPDTCQARVLRAYLTASLLGGDTTDVRFYTNGVCLRHASFA